MMAMSVTLAPRARMAVNACKSHISFIFLNGALLSHALRTLMIAAGFRSAELIQCLESFRVWCSFESKMRVERLNPDMKNTKID